MGGGGGGGRRVERRGCVVRGVLGVSVRERGGGRREMGGGGEGRRGQRGATRDEKGKGG